ncbi:MAG TPA: GtrA family protein [Candidatus Saccharimonadales bacterium]|nr:GtrA family protein [Candidatus Saccharimonadales bacterium]
MIEKVKELHRKNEEFSRYFIMAIIVVGIEYFSYVGMVAIGVQYLLAVPISMAVGIVLNWYGSRAFVFKTRRHAPHKEFTLVLIASLIGVGIQTLVTYLVVHNGGTPPLGKLLAIFVTFFWNYFARKKYIF